MANNPLTRREALRLGAIAGASLLVPACAPNAPSPDKTPTSTAPIPSMESFKKLHPLLSEEARRQFVVDVQKGAKDQLGQAVAKRLPGLSEGTINTSRTIATFAYDPLFITRSPGNAAECIWSVDKNDSKDSKFLTILNQAGQDKLFPGITLGIGMPTDSDAWKTATAFTKSVLAEKEVLNAGMIDDFSEYVLRLLIKQGFQYGLVDEQGKILKTANEFTQEERYLVGLYYFLNNIDAGSKISSGVCLMFSPQQLCQQDGITIYITKENSHKKTLIVPPLVLKKLQMKQAQVTNLF